MAPVELRYVERTFAVLGDGYHDWIDVKHFALRPSTCPAGDALAGLLAHVRFRDTYAAKDSHEDNSVSIHGPFELASIGVESYESISSDAARETLRSFVTLYGAPAVHTDRLATMDAATARTLDAADEIFRVRDLGEAAHHEWGWVVRDFTELVAIDRTEGRLSLIVAAQD
jgi:hypothetical protein